VPNRWNQQPDIVVETFTEGNPFSFLSNFYDGHPFTWRDLTFPTAEHAFVYAKLNLDRPDGNEYIRWILATPTAGQVKRLGRKVPLREDWETVKFDLMREIVWAKFSQNPDLAVLLCNTGDAYLQEGNTWNDTIWGVRLDSSVPWQNRVGENMLGIILMETRAKLAAQTLQP